MTSLKTTGGRDTEQWDRCGQATVLLDTIAAPPNAFYLNSCRRADCSDHLCGCRGPASDCLLTIGLLSGSCTRRTLVLLLVQLDATAHPAHAPHRQAQQVEQQHDDEEDEQQRDEADQQAAS